MGSIEEIESAKGYTEQSWVGEAGELSSSVEEGDGRLGRRLGGRVSQSPSSSSLIRLWLGSNRGWELSARIDELGSGEGREQMLRSFLFFESSSSSASGCYGFNGEVWSGLTETILL